jgi:hypothetical protein
MRLGERYVGALLSGALCLPMPLSAAETIEYGYGALGRLTAASSSGMVNSNQAVATTFDAAGNRTNYTVTGAASAISISSTASVTEGGNWSFTVTRSSTTGTASVSYATASGTATSGSDVMARSGTVTFGPGMTSQTVTVTTATTPRSSLPKT